jgi:hypothetical protein
MQIKIIQLERNLPDGIVKIAHWTAHETTKDEFYASTYGSVTFDAPGETIIPYEDLSEEEVISWIKSKIDLESIQQILNNEIEEKRNPKSAFGTPWTTMTPHQP